MNLEYSNNRKKIRVLNSKGEPVTLNRQEKVLANVLQKKFNSELRNALGFEVDITTLTTITKSITEQKFFEVAPADYMPVRVGEGAWSASLLTYRSFMLADAFETGIINMGTENSRIANADAGVDALQIQVFNWAKSCGWTIFEIQQAAKSGNWDVVTAKEESRKQNWDLGIQKTLFLGSPGNNGASGNCQGLLNQTGVTVNTTTITKPISTMSAAQLKEFCGLIYNDYRTNCFRTAVPTHFIVPESDYNGMASQSSPDFPIKSILEVITDMFRTMTQNMNFKVLPISYGDLIYHADAPTIAGKQVYTMLNYDPKSLRADVPLAYTNTLANSINNFQFQNVAYGQFTGLKAYRPLELLYWQF